MTTFCCQQVETATTSIAAYFAGVVVGQSVDTVGGTVEYCTLLFVDA
jgi:hypothetical protein